MSVTGEFLADFLDFIRGAKAAEKALDDLEGKGTSAAKGLEQSFDFDKINFGPLEQGTAGVKKLFAVLEGGAAGAALGATTVATALVAMANSAANTADSLGDLSDKTGMTVPELSRLSTAAELAGTNVGALSDLAFTMQQRMQKNPEEFARGLKALSINAKEFADAGPAQQVEMFTRALASQDDQVRRNNAGLDIAGKSYKELAPALIDLGGGAYEAADGIGHLFTEQDKRNAEAYHLELNKMKLTFKGVSDDIGSYVIPILGELAKETNAHIALWRTGAKEFGAWFAAAHEAAGLKPTDRGLDPKEIKDQFKAAFGADNLTDLAKFRAELETTTNSKVRDKEITKELAEQERAREKALREEAEAAKKYAAAGLEIQQAGEGWRQTLADMNPIMVEGIKHLLEMGVSQEALATRYGYTAVQIKAVNTQLTEEQKTAADTMKAERELVLTMQKLWADYNKTVGDGSYDTTQKQIDAIWAQANATELSLAQQGKWSTEASAVIVANAQKQTDNVLNGIMAQDKGTREYYVRMAEEAEGAYRRAIAAGDQVTPRRLEQLRTESEAAKAALVDWQYVAEAAMDDVTSAAVKTTEAMTKARDAAHEAFMPGTFTAPDTGLHQETRFGQPVLVNEAGQVVQANLQAQHGVGGMLGYSLPPGTSMNNVVNVNGILMSNDPYARQQLADVIGRTLTDTAKGQGQRLGSGV